jgi:putative FmdB family regulatory protein
MPRYEFICNTCGLKFERALPIGSDQTEIRCPSGHRKVHRVYSTPFIMFKGSGFYVTDHPSGSGTSEFKN